MLPRSLKGRAHKHTFWSLVLLEEGAVGYNFLHANGYRAFVHVQTGWWVALFLSSIKTRKNITEKNNSVSDPASGGRFCDFATLASRALAASRFVGNNAQQ